METHCSIPWLWVLNPGNNHRFSKLLRQHDDITKYYLYLQPGSGNRRMIV